MKIFENSVTLESRDVIEEYLRGFDYKTSGLTFTSLYMWRVVNDFSWEIIDDYLCIAGVNKLENAPDFHYLMPVLTRKGGYDFKKLADVIYRAKEIFENKGIYFTIMLVPFHMLEMYAEALPGKLSFEADRPNFDYVYNAIDLIELNGRDFHTKKNHLNYFKRNCSYEYTRMNSGMADEAMAFIRKFNEQKNLSNVHARALLLMEEVAMDDVFRNLESVGYLSGAILIDGNIEALSIGGRQGKNTITVHIEKANTQFRGLYQAINNEFCIHNAKNIKRINREEDLGIPGLRKAKLSYKPCMMVEKYKVIFREQEGLNFLR
jgi:hypothetical protein